MTKPLLLGDARYIQCLGYSGILEFVVSVPHGKGHRDVRAQIPIKKLRELAKVFEGWPHDHLGHAWWHHEHDAPVPCESCPILESGGPAKEAWDEHLKGCKPCTVESQQRLPRGYIFREALCRAGDRLYAAREKEAWEGFGTVTQEK